MKKLIINKIRYLGSTWFIWRLGTRAAPIIDFIKHFVVSPVFGVLPLPGEEFSNSLSLSKLSLQQPSLQQQSRQMLSH